MARKFLYFIVFIVVLIIAALAALRQWPGPLSEWAFVPKVAFEQQAPLAANRYDDPALWISRPGMGSADPSAWLPAGVKADFGTDPEDALAVGARPSGAVFFIHPTSYLAKAHWNAPLDDGDANALTQRLVRALASAFNASGNVWVPRYRQAAFGAFLTAQPEAQQALALAYGDVGQAFDAFLAATPPDEPIILVGHSQGARHLLQLLKDRVAGKPLARRIIAAYVIGWPISLAHDLPTTGLPACAAPEQSGCILSWQSYGEPADPSLTKAAYARSAGLDGELRGSSLMLCTNPLTGSIDSAAPARANLGTLVAGKDEVAAKLVPGLVPARCDADGFLLIGDPPDLGPYVLPGNNYHVYDIPLFWGNVRADVARRVSRWQLDNAVARAIAAGESAK